MVSLYAGSGMQTSARNFLPLPWHSIFETTLPSMEEATFIAAPTLTLV